jgi:hypothetical protein
LQQKPTSKNKTDSGSTNCHKEREREREREREQFVLVFLLTTHLTIRGNPLSFLLKKTSMTKEHELAKVARSGLKFRNLCFSMAS